MKDLKTSASLLLGFLFLLLLVSVFSVSQQKPAAGSFENRFVLINSTVTGGDPNRSGSDDKELFLLDSQTGHVWQFIPTIPTNNGTMIEQHFTRVFVNEIDGDYGQHILNKNKK